MLLADGSHIQADDLRLGETGAVGTARDAQSVIKIPPTGIALEEIERMALIEALKMSNWVQKDAAELLSISPRVMNYKIKTLGIDFPRGRRAQPTPQLEAIELGRELRLRDNEIGRADLELVESVANGDGRGHAEPGLPQRHLEHPQTAGVPIHQ
jgi:hypothetical protein